MYRRPRLWSSVQRAFSNDRCIFDPTAAKDARALVEDCSLPRSNTGLGMIKAKAHLLIP
jgi:hypothetical protein